jgi:hypothetical protein
MQSGAGTISQSGVNPWNVSPFIPSFNYPFQILPSDRTPTPRSMPLFPLLPFLSSSSTPLPLCPCPCSLHCRIPFLRCTQTVINNNSSSRSSSSSNGILRIPEPTLPRILLSSVAKEETTRTKHILRTTRAIISMPTINSKDHIVLCLIIPSTIRL